jgi:hypothetical protein
LNESREDHKGHTWRVARSPALAGWRVLVAAGWFTVALAVLLALPDVIPFTFHSTSGIQGWVSANHYPKQQEMFWFLAAVVGVPVVMLVGWLGWLLAAAVGARVGKCQPAAILKAFAFWHVTLLVAWPGLCRLRVDAWKLLLPAAGVGLVLAVLTVLFTRFVLTRRNRNQDEEFESRACGNHEDHKGKFIFTRLRRKYPNPSRALRLLFTFFSFPNSVASPPRLVWRTVVRRGWALVTWVLLFVVIPVMLYLLRLNPVHSGGVDLFHEGEFLVPLNEMLHGGVPYRDIYLQHGLFHNAWIPWLGAKLFEPTLTGVRAIHAYIEPLGCVGLYYFVLVICRTRLIPAAFLVLLCFGSLGGVSPRALFGLLSISVLAAAITTPYGFRILAGVTSPDPRPDWRGLFRLGMRQGWPLLVAGALAMLAFWYSVEVGLYVFVTGGLFLAAASFWQAGIRLWRRTLPLACYAVGVLVAVLPVAVYLGAHGAFDDFVRNIWIQCVYQNDTWGRAFPNFFEVLRPILATEKPPKWPSWLITGKIQWYYGPIAFTLAAAFLAFRAMGAGFWRSRTAPMLLLVTLAGISFFRTALGRSDESHFKYGVFFALILVLFLCDRLLAAAWDCATARGVRFVRRLGGLPWLAAGLLCSYCVVWFGLTAYDPVPKFKKRWEKFPSWPVASVGKTETVPRAGLVIISEKEAEKIRKVTDYITTHTRSDEPVFDFAGQAGFLFFADRRSATRYFQISYASLPVMQEEVVSDLERQKVSLVIFRASSYFDGVDGVPVETRHPIIAAYLRDKFELAEKVGPVVFWRRKVAPVPQTIPAPPNPSDI